MRSWTRKEEGEGACPTCRGGLAPRGARRARGRTLCRCPPRSPATESMFFNIGLSPALAFARSLFTSLVRALSLSLPPSLSLSRALSLYTNQPCVHPHGGGWVGPRGPFRTGAMWMEGAALTIIRVSAALSVHVAWQTNYTAHK
jgi:hypothetical protein